MSRKDTLIDDEWEDVPDKAPSSRQSSLPPTFARQRRRNAGVKTVYITSQTTRKSAKSRARSQPLNTPLVDREELGKATRIAAASTVRYMGDILNTAFGLLRKPLGVLLFLWILGVLFVQLSHTFRTVFSPVCYIPGISRSSFCQTSYGSNAVKQADYTRLADIEASNLGHLMSESVDASGLSIDIKRAQMATSDLILLVRASNMSSRDALADALKDFVGDAKKASRGLQSLGAKISGAVDSIVAVNDHAMRAIEASQAEPSGLIQVWPFATSKEQRAQEVALATFSTAMDMLASTVERIVLEAELELAHLERLEEHLVTIQEIVSREDASISSKEEELLASLWTRFGWNKKQLRTYERHLALLQNVSAYRSRALAHVTAALHTLGTLSADMEELRDRAAAPEIIGDRIPAAVHMESIRGGIERLKEGRQKAKEREELVMRNILGINGVDKD